MACTVIICHLNGIHMVLVQNGTIPDSFVNPTMTSPRFHLNVMFQFLSCCGINYITGVFPS